MDAIAGLLQEQGKLAEAEALYAEVLEARKRTLGPTHKDTLVCMRSFASVLQAQGKLMQAEGCYSECLEAMQRTLGRTNVSTLKTMAGFAQVMVAQGRLAEAQAMLVDCVAGMREVQRPEDADTEAVFCAAKRQLEALMQRS